MKYLLGSGLGIPTVSTFCPSSGLTISIPRSFLLFFCIDAKCANSKLHDTPDYITIPTVNQEKFLKFQQRHRNTDINHKIHRQLFHRFVNADPNYRLSRIKIHNKIYQYIT